MASCEDVNFELCRNPTDTRMLRWMVVTTAILTALANVDRAVVGQGTVAIEPTGEVKGQQGAELTLACGDGKSSGVVQCWHTPFGDLWRPGFVDAGRVLMQSDRALVVSNCSQRHSGLYYCLLQDTWGTTLWPYQVHIHPDHRGLEEVLVASRSRSNVWSEDGVSEQDLAAAVAAAVLLTFVVGFSTGALSRTYVLRCLGAIRTRMRSPRQQSAHADGSGVTLTTLPPWYGDQKAEPTDGDETMETTVLPTSSSPPIKPQRSFRQKGDKVEMSAYLEGCGHIKGEETTSYLNGCGHIEEEEGLEENQEEGMYGGLYLSGGNEKEKGDNKEEEERSEETHSRQEEKRDKEEERSKEETQRRQEEVKGDKEEERREEKETQGSQGEAKEDERDDNEEEGWKEKESQRRGEEKGDEEGEETREKETKGRRQEQEEEVQCTHSETSSESRRHRVIRLYQYDEEGQRYRHLPDPSPDESGPTPRLHQRSVSLTRLNAIMAAALAGPLDPDGVAGRREEMNFHMDI